MVRTLATTQTVIGILLLLISFNSTAEQNDYGVCGGYKEQTEEDIVTTTLNQAANSNI